MTMMRNMKIRGLIVKKHYPINTQLWLYKSNLIKGESKFSYQLQEKIFCKFIGYENEF